MKLEPVEQIYVDMETKKFYRARPDDPQNPYHPLSPKQAVDLSNQLRRYEDDWRTEHNPTIK